MPRVDSKQKPHSTFRVEGGTSLEELEDAGVDVLSANTLFQRYVSKISQGFREIVLSRV